MTIARVLFVTTVLMFVFVISGCAPLVRVENLEEAQCRESLQETLSSILKERGETLEVARLLAVRTSDLLASADIGPRPFLVASSSGADYTFLFQKKAEHCVVRLYGIQKGWVSHTNNINYLATRELSGCTCRE